jgi:hypothetical protein
MPQESTQDCSGARLDDEHPAALTGMLLEGGGEFPGRAFALACAPSDCDLTDVLLHACTVEVHDDAVSQLVSSADQLLRDDLGLPLVMPLPDACVDVLSAQASLARWAATAVTVARQAGEALPRLGQVGQCGQNPALTSTPSAPLWVWALS